MVGGSWKRLSVSVLLVLCLQAAAFGQAKPSLIGAWQGAGPAGPISLIFESNDRLNFDGEPAKYTLAPGIIRVDDGEEVIDYPFILAGDLLTVTFPEGLKMQFKRARSVQPPTVKNEPGRSPSAEVESSMLASEISGIW